MKNLSIILALLILSSCSNINQNWEDKFKDNAERALIKQEYFDANFYLTELNSNSFRHKDFSDSHLTHFPVISNFPNRIRNDDEKAHNLFLKSKSSFLPLYHHSGTLEDHIVKLKTLSKNVDGRGINIIMRVNESNSNIYYSYDSEINDGFGEEDDFGEGDSFNSYKQRTLTYSATNTSIYDVIKDLCSEHNLRFKITEHAIIIADKGHGCCLEEVRFYDCEDYQIINNYEDFEFFLKSFIIQYPGCELQFISRVNRLIIKDHPVNHKLIENFLIPNFIENIEITHYQYNGHERNNITRAEIEKKPHIFKKLSSRNTHIRYKTTRIIDNLKFTYTIKEQTQIINISAEDKVWSLSYLGACDKILKLDKNNLILLKVR